METIFQKYKVYFIIAGIVSVVFATIVVIVLVLNQQETSEQPVTNTDPNQLDYGFIQDEQLSNEDKFLMLQAKIIIEQYGTYSKTDVRGLTDVRNQATPAFQARIDSITNAVGNKDIITTVNAESISLIRTSSGAVQVKLSANETDLSTQTQKNISYLVELVESGPYWLVNNIQTNE